MNCCSDFFFGAFFFFGADVSALGLSGVGLGLSTAKAGIEKLKSLGHDDNADVANLIGYSSRKLGRYDDSKLWYERALAADPAHARTWSYYGMWHAEQGNLLKAREYLAKVETLCGNTKCRAYTELKGVIEGTRTY